MLFRMAVIAAWICATVGLAGTAGITTNCNAVGAGIAAGAAGATLGAVGTVVGVVGVVTGVVGVVVGVVVGACV